MDTATLTSLRLRLDLPGEVVLRYEGEAAHRGMTLEELIQERLIACSAYNSTSPIYLDDANRRRLESMFKRNFRGALDLMRHIESALSVMVQNVKVELSPELLRRLKSRSGGRFEEYLSKTVVTELEHFVGMR